MSANYFGVWRQFNKFLIRLDVRPPKWEDRAILFCGYLVESGYQSSTIKSYMSAIKAVLIDDGYPWNNDLAVISSLTRACRLVNNKVKCRLPIQCGLLEILLFEIQRLCGNDQPYLEILYKTIFAIAYYGLMRISEVTWGTHTLKAKDVHMGQNKNKILIVLHTSKTHGEESLPQKIKISALDEKTHNEFLKHRFFCPFQLMHTFIHTHGGYCADSKLFFVFAGGTPARPAHVHTLLQELLEKVNLDATLYDTHNFRAGRMVDLHKMSVSIEDLKKAGRWKSNAIFRYLAS